jgi:ABC-type Fe3+ transport system substrate-binding protein
MRALPFILLFLLVLMSPFALRYFTGAAPAADLSSSGDRLVVVTPNNPDIRREFAWAFSAWHERHYGTPVTLDFRAVGAATSDIKRLLQTSYDSVRLPNRQLPPEDQIAGQINIQIAWSGGDTFFDRELKPMGILAPLHLSPAQIATIFPQPTLAGVNLYDQEPDHQPRWAGVVLSSFGIMYNPDLYRALQLDPPLTWSDLTDPRLVGQVALADPTHSASVGVCYMMVIERAMADAEAAYWKDHPGDKGPGYHAALSDGFHRGMETLLLMAANARYFTDSSTQPPSDVSNGQAAAALAIDFYARVSAEEVGNSRARFVVPANATAITPDPVAILYGTLGHQRELADHFVEFLFSREGQLLWILKAGTPGGPRERALRRPPIRRDVYSTDTSNWTDHMNPFTEAGAFNMRGDWMALFTDIRPIWAAAWIDERDSLVKAYNAVLSESDDARRSELLQELSDVPVTLSDVEADVATRKQKEAAGNADEWKALSRIGWEKKFRDHYQSVLTTVRL